MHKRDENYREMYQKHKNLHSAGRRTVGRGKKFSSYMDVTKYIGTALDFIQDHPGIGQKYYKTLRNGTLKVKGLISTFWFI